MIRICVLIAGLSFTSAAFAGVYPVIPDECAVTVRFFSHSIGIDRTLVNEVRSYAEEQESIERTIETGWGREGELDICLIPVSEELDQDIFEHIKALLPEHAKRGTVEVIGKDGLSYRITEPLR